MVKPKENNGSALYPSIRQDSSIIKEAEGAEGVILSKVQQGFPRGVSQSVRWHRVKCTRLIKANDVDSTIIRISAQATTWQTLNLHRRTRHLSQTYQFVIITVLEAIVRRRKLYLL